MYFKKHIEYFTSQFPQWQTAPKHLSPVGHGGRKGTLLQNWRVTQRPFGDATNHLGWELPLPVPHKMIICRLFTFFFWEGDLHQKPIHFVTIAFWEGEHPNMLHFSIFGSYSFYIYIKGPPRVQHKTRHARNHGPQLVVLFQQTNWCGSLDQPGGEKIMKLPPTQVPLKLKENKPLIRTPNKKWHHLRRLTHSSEHDPNCVWSIRIRIRIATGLCVFFFALWHKCS